MERVAKRPIFSLALGLLVSLCVALAGCGPAAASPSELQPAPTRPALERLEGNPDTTSVSIPNPDVTPVPSPIPPGDDEPLEFAPDGAEDSVKAATGPVKPRIQSTGAGGQPQFRIKKPNDGLTVQGSAQPGISGQVAPQPLQEYTWRDGDRTLTVLLQPDLTLQNAAAVRSSQEVLASTGRWSITGKPDGSGGSASDGNSGSGAGVDDLPVFRSLSGTLMTLPGGVLLVLDEAWNNAQVLAFFSRNWIEADRISELDYAINGFFVETDPGFPSLQLANMLAEQEGVEVSSPNWWREVVAK